MQFVRADSVLGLLRQLAVLSQRQELRRDRRGADVAQHRSRLPAELGLGRPLDQIAHQRLRHPRVDVIHRHVIAVVGAPAQRQLRKIARADVEAADLVGDVHQNLCPFARLGVFVGHIVLALVVADVPEVPPHGVADRDRPQRRAQVLGQPLGVAARAHRGAEAGHGDGDDPRPR